MGSGRGYDLPDALNLGRPAWHTRAACRGHGPHDFYVTSSRTEPVRELCARCPVRNDCLADALERGDRHGIWGGLDANERRAIKVRRRSGG